MTGDVANILKTNLDFIRDNAHMNLDFVYLQIDHLTTLLGNNEFMGDLKDMVNQILDRDDNGVFDEKDVKLLRNIFTNKENQLLNIYSFIMEIFNAVLALIGKVDKPVLKMNRDAVEGIFFGVLSYIMFQYAATNDADRRNIMEIMIAIHDIVKTVDNTFGVTKKILDLLKKKGWCKCLYTDTENKLDREIMRSRQRVRELSVSIKESQKLRERIDDLERRLEN